MIHILNLSLGIIPAFTYKDVRYYPDEFYFMRKYGVNEDNPDGFVLARLLFEQEYLNWIRKQSSDEIWISRRGEPYTCKADDGTIIIGLMSLAKLQDGKIIWARGEDEWVD